MTGLSSKEFNDAIKKIQGVKYNRYTDVLLYRGRKVYVLLDGSNQDRLHPPHHSLYYFWRTYQGFKLANPNWISTSGERVQELAVLLTQEDKIKGEYLQDLASPKPISKLHITNPEDFNQWLDISQGHIIRRELKEPKDIEKLLRTIY